MRPRPPISSEFVNIHPVIRPAFVPVGQTRHSSQPYYTTAFADLSGWTDPGGTWAVDGSGAYNTPTEGTELLTDPGLEANYTAGLCDTLTKNGTPTVAQSADAHGGSKAQRFTATAFLNRLQWAGASVAANTWLQFAIWGKRTAGTSGLAKAGLLGGANSLANFQAITAAGYTRYPVTTRTTAADTISPYAVRDYANSGWDTVIVDDGTFKVLTNLRLTRAFAQAIAAWSAALTVVQGTQAGLRVNATADGSSYVEVFVSLNNTGTTSEQKVYLEKVVSGTRTAVNSANITYGAGKVLTIKNNGDDTYTVSYDGVAVLSNQAIADSVFDTATYAGPFSTYNSNRISAFTYDARPS